MPHSPGEGLELCSNSQILSDLLHASKSTFLLDVVVSAAVIYGSATSGMMQEEQVEDTE